MKLKKLDYVVIAVLVLITIVSTGYRSYIVYNNNKFEKYVEIIVDGKLYKTVPLKDESENLEIKTNLGENTIVIENGEVHIDSATCRDKLCVKGGKIKNIGQILVCLPNKVVVEIKGEKSNEDLDSVTY